MSPTTLEIRNERPAYWLSGLPGGGIGVLSVSFSLRISGETIFRIKILLCHRPIIAAMTDPGPELTYSNFWAGQDANVSHLQLLGCDSIHNQASCSVGHVF